MDERTKALVDALLDRHPRGCVAERAGFAVTKTAAGMYRLMCVALLSDDDTVPSDQVVRAVRTMFARHWDSAPEMAKVGDAERADALSEAGQPEAEKAARTIGTATAYVIEHYDGDLGRLRDAAKGDHDRLRKLIDGIPGIGTNGRTLFLREAQAFWPEAGPVLDDRATRAAKRLGLPDTAEDLLTDVARGSGYERLAWLAGALALVDFGGEYDAIREAAGG